MFGVKTPMLTALTLALCAAHTSVHAPEPVATPDALKQSDVRVVLQANETHFVATNTSFDVAVLVFGSEELGVLSTLRLAPGGTVTFGHAGDDEADVWVEVVCISPTRIDSGAHQVSDIIDEGGALWIVQNNATLEIDRATSPGLKEARGSCLSRLLVRPRRVQVSTLVPGDRHGTTQFAHDIHVEVRDDELRAIAAQRERLATR